MSAKAPGVRLQVSGRSVRIYGGSSSGQASIRRSHRISSGTPTGQARNNFYEINHYQLKVGSMVIWLEAGSQAKATSPTECG